MLSTQTPIVHTIFEKVTGTCQYIVADPSTKEAVIIDSVLDYDPAGGLVTTTSSDQLLSKVDEMGYKVIRILETHAHADHLTASQYLKRKLNNVPVCIGHRITTVQKTFASIFNIPKSSLATDGSQFDHLWHDNENWKVGEMNAQTIHTPGHTKDSVSYLIGNSLFTGDSIFQPDVGTARCDFPGGCSNELFNSIQRLFQLPDSTIVYVGHDYPPEGREAYGESTIGFQKATNKHVKVGTSLEEFSNWRSTRDKSLGPPRLIFPAIQVNIRAGRFPEKEDNGQIYFKIPLKFPIHFES